MRVQETMRRPGFMHWGNRDIVLHVRIAPSGELRRDVMQVQVESVKGISLLPKDATCVLDVWRGKENVHQRLPLGLVGNLTRPTAWLDVEMLPADSRLMETKFQLRAVSADRKYVIAECEKGRPWSGERTGMSSLFSILVTPPDRMDGAFYDIEPGWNGSLPMPVRVSSAVRNVKARLQEGEPELSMALLSMILPHALTQMFPRCDLDGDDDFYLAWTGFMLSNGVGQTQLDSAASPEVGPQGRARACREIVSLLVSRFASKLNNAGKEAA